MSERSDRLAHNDRQNCEVLFAKGLNQIIFRTLVADTQTPVGMMMKLSKNHTYHCLLESVEGGRFEVAFPLLL